MYFLYLYFLYHNNFTKWFIHTKFRKQGLRKNIFYIQYTWLYYTYSSADSIPWILSPPSCSRLLFPLRLVAEVWIKFSLLSWSMQNGKCIALDLSATFGLLYLFVPFPFLALQNSWLQWRLGPECWWGEWRSRELLCNNINIRYRVYLCFSVCQQDIFPRTHNFPLKMIWNSLYTPTILRND